MDGEALVAAYNGPRLAWAYDQWPIVALAYVARFGWLGALAGCLVGRDLRGGLGAQASVDGAGRTAGMFYISLPRHAALLGGIGMTVLALSLAEVASTSMVRVPAFSPISQVIIEKFHRFEDDMLISLSFVLIAASVLGAVLVARAGRRFDSRW
jgi:ABC-type Fe3+ transport system permease subunit